MDSEPVTIAVEGSADVSVVTRVVEHVGLCVGPVHIQRGKANLDKKLAAYNHAAHHGRWLVVRDLDRDAPCAAALVAEKLPASAPYMLFRVAVRAAEAWLLADQEGMSGFLKVGLPLIPLAPDGLEDPKQTLVNLARQSRDRAIREEMVPEEGTATRVGPNYTGRIIEFAARFWDPASAALRSDSLRRCIEAMQRWTSDGAPMAARPRTTAARKLPIRLPGRRRG